MSKFMIFGRQYSRQFLAIAVFMGVDFLTGLVEYLRGIQDGSIRPSWLSFGIFLATATVSLLNIIKASQSQAWHKAANPDPIQPLSK